jgi:hypothetical protein
MELDRVTLIDVLVRFVSTVSLFFLRHEFMYVDFVFPLNK